MGGYLDTMGLYDLVCRTPVSLVSSLVKPLEDLNSLENSKSYKYNFRFGQLRLKSRAFLLLLHKISTAVSLQG